MIFQFCMKEKKATLKSGQKESDKMSTGCFPASSETFRVENVKLPEFEYYKEKK